MNPVTLRLVPVVMLCVMAFSRSAEAQEQGAPAPATPPAAAPASVPAPPIAFIQHQPVNQAQSRKAVRLVFRVDHPQLAGRIRVHVRADDSERDQEIGARRSANGYTARVPVELVEPPGFSYWATERMPDGQERAVFADAESPHPVVVVDSPETEYEREALERRGGHRSRVDLSGEYVNFGSRQLPGGESPLADRYYRLEASYSHGLFRIVDEIRFSVGRVRGDAGEVTMTYPDLVAEDLQVGIDYGSAEVTWLAMPVLRVRTSLLFGFSQQGFEFGAAGAFVIGDPDAMTLTAGVEGITTLGWTARLRLGWFVVPRVPMGATVEVTTFPAGEDAGVRLIQDIGYELYPGSVVRVRAGYQSRTSVNGGFSAGAELGLAF